MIDLLWILFLPLSMAIIQVQQGATTHEITLARTYKDLKTFKSDFLGKSKCYNLVFDKVTADELRHLPDDLYSELNKKQSLQIVEQCKEAGITSGGCKRALKMLFKSKDAIKEAQVNWLKDRDFDILGYDSEFIPLSVLCKKNLEYFVDRWSSPKPSHLVRKELQILELKQLIDNSEIENVKLKKKFLKNLHSQQSYEHWPKKLKTLAQNIGINSGSLNRNLGVSGSASEDSDSSESTDSDSEPSSAKGEEEEEEEEAVGRINRTRTRLPFMRRAAVLKRHL